MGMRVQVNGVKAWVPRLSLSLPAGKKLIFPFEKYDWRILPSMEPDEIVILSLKRANQK
jgi:hypothetical protein